MSTTSAALAPLQSYRQQLYTTVLGRRQDSAFELLDSVLVGDAPTSVVRLSLAPVFRRRWPSAGDALSDGTLEPGPLRRLCVRSLPTPPVGEREVWALDGSVWPRPNAAASPERTYGYRALAGEPSKYLVPAWEYQWLVALPEPGSSWVLPLDVRRRVPGAGTPTELALQQVTAVLRLRPAGPPRPVITFDSGYAPGPLAEAHLAADLLVRLAKKRTCHRAPGPYKGMGARPKHGSKFKLHDPTTHGPPDATATAPDPRYGQITVRVWTGLHEPAAPDAPFTVVQVQVARLPGGKPHPAPLWLAWIGETLPDDLLALDRWYRQRFQFEHGFRFLKHDLGWTTARPRTPAAADRWTRLLAAGLWELWLARPLVADARLPWERPRPPAQLTPGRVRRAFGGRLPGLGSPARAPKIRGTSPGRRLGTRVGAHPPQPVVRRPRTDGPCRCPTHRPRTRTAA